MEDLEISGNLIDMKCWLLDVSSLVKVKLTFYISCIKNKPSKDGTVTGISGSCDDYHHNFRMLVDDYLEKLRCATQLTVGSWFTEVPYMLQFKEFPVFTVEL